MAKRYNIKVEFKGCWMEYADCIFIESMDDYKVYMQELNNKFAVSESEIKNNKTWIGHGHSRLTAIAGMGNMIENIEEREPMLFNLKLLHARVLSDQLKDIMEGKKLVINKSGGYFSIKPDQKYEVVAIGNDKYTESDIKIKKWWGGLHYYAKVGEVDVVDEFGNVKWNTEKRAREIALKYMHDLNNNVFEKIK
jgi:S-adenosylmethionine hydrolase